MAAGAGGYLVRNRSKFRAGVDLDSLQTPGIYACRTPVNGPGANDYLVEVYVGIAIGMNFIAQRAFDLSTNTTYSRVWDGDSWIAWANTGSPDALVFRGAIDCSTNPNYPAAAVGDLYRVSVAGKIGGASGVSVEAGDLITCVVANGGGTEAAVGADFVISQTNTDGAVIGPASAPDEDIARFDGTSGKLIKSGLSVDQDPDMMAASDDRVPSQSAVVGYAEPLIGYTTEDVANKSTDIDLGTSDELYPSQNAVREYADQVYADAVTYADTKEPLIGFTPENVANKSNDTAMSGDSATLYPTQHAAKTYADTKVPLSYLDTDGALTTNSDTKVATQKATKTYADTKIPLSYLDTDGTLSANSDTRVATQKAVKTYADQIIASADAMVFKGVIDCSGNPNYPSADRGWTYRVSVAGKIGGASGTNVEIGDLLLCLDDGTASGTQAAQGSHWSVAQTNIDGAVVGPASAVNSNFVTFSGTTGKIIQDSGIGFDTDTALTANSDAKIASQKAVKAYADTKLAKTSNLSDLSDASVARGNLGLATSTTIGRLARFTGTTGAQGQTTGLFEDGSGNVGIGTTSPLNLMHLSKAVAAGTVNYLLKLQNSTAGATDLRAGLFFNPTVTDGYGPTIQGRNDGVTGAGDLIFGVLNNGTPSEYMRINYLGNVGIGTTSPLLPLDVVSVGGNVAQFTAYGGSSGALLLHRANGTIGSPTQVLTGERIGALFFGGYTSAGAFGNSAAITGFAGENFTSGAQGTYLKFETTAIGGTSRTEKMRITDAGNVGIGTAGPGSKLTIADTDKAFLTNTANLWIGSTDAAADNKGGSIALGDVDGLSYGFIKGARQASDEGYLAFGTWKGGVGNAERMRITNTGNVGIGTTNPATKLEVSGSITTTPVTVATLPAANLSVGQRHFVTDGSTTVILGLGLTVVGGGANKVPVYSDGTNWIVG